MEFGRKASRFLLLVLQETLREVRTQLVKVIRSLSLRSKVLINVMLVVFYGYLLATSNEWSGDHMEIGCIHVLTFLPTLRFLFSLYSTQFLAVFLRLLSVYGWIRFVLYVVFVVVFSYVFVAILLDRSTLACMHKARELFISRFENNIMSINEDRQFFDRHMHRPLSDDSRSSGSVFQMMRYPMEDAQMNCTAYVKGFPGGKPFSDQVEWRRNGIPLKTMTDRYSVVTTSQELPADHFKVDEKMKALGLKAYEIRSTLSIYLLEEADFGSYTCHMLEKIDVPLDDWESKTGKKPDPKYFKRKENAKTKKESEKQQQCCQCYCLPEKKYFYQDLHSHIEEYRLIQMGEKHDQIEAPLSSILFFSTSYSHLSSDGDVFSDYTVNDISVEGLCSNSSRFHDSGCSSMQRFLALFMYDDSQTWRFLNFLPFYSTRRNYFTYFTGAYLSSGHCLCENSFGRHNMKYTRRYYNRTAGKYQMFEIMHPHTLLVRPPQQKSPSFFDVVWTHGRMKLLPLTDCLPEHIYDSTVLRDLAIVSGIILNWIDGVFICVAIVAFGVVLHLNLRVLQNVGQISRRCLLEGSMGYLPTAQSACRNISRDIRKKAKNAENQKFDLFLSHSDAQTDQHLVSELAVNFLEQHLGLTVCLRQRDIPPDMLEIEGLEQAIENSRWYIIFLSKDYIQDPFRQTEAAMIFEVLWDRDCKSNVLVIKLDDSRIPGHWTEFTVHDWTSNNLSMDDHRLRLTQWLSSHMQQASGFRSILDGLITFSPFLWLTFLLIRTLF